MPLIRPPTLTDYPYHLGARTVNKAPFPIAVAQVWEIMERHLFALAHVYDVEIHAFVLMRNHFHLLASFPEGNISLAMMYFMRQTSLEIGARSGRINQIYGGRHYRCLIHSPHYFLQAYKYLYLNPVRAGICERAEGYEFSTLRGLLGLQKFLVPMIEDTTLFSDVEATLGWINTPPDAADTQIIRRALKRKRFALPRCPRTQHEHSLETRLL